MTVRTSVYRFSFSDNPNGEQLNPQVIHAVGTLAALLGRQCGEKKDNKKPQNNKKSSNGTKVY